MHNRLADALSCDKLSSFLPKAYQMEQSPLPIPVKLLELLQAHSAYQAATKCFSSFCSEFHIASPYALTEHILCQYV